MDTVFIQGLELQSLIGVYDFERHAKQLVVVDLEVSTDLSKARESDDVNDTVDYGAIAQRLETIANESSFHLLEALADKMVKAILNEFSVEQLKLTMHKPDILDNAKSVGIVINAKAS
jgi:dihydroneopterin aldolase